MVTFEIVRGRDVLPIAIFVATGGVASLVAFTLRQRARAARRRSPVVLVLFIFSLFCFYVAASIWYDRPDFINSWPSGAAATRLPAN